MVGVNDIGTAILALDANAEITVRGNTFDSIEWIDKNPNNITWEQIQAKQAELTTAYNNAAYQRNRKAEYPSIADQLDKIYHDGIDAWKVVIKATKDKYPKE
jgi:hypothetical protein|tara:strand:- start:666 stop:971 length:306 start_codon:yes stop_codon:yes gene_type:complete